MFEIIVGFLVGFLVWRVMSAYREMQQTREEIHAEVIRMFIVMTVEHNQDGVFAYNAKSGEFLAHGQTFKEMTENFKSRFPNKKGLVVGNNTIEEIE